MTRKISTLSTLTAIVLLFSLSCGASAKQGDQHAEPVTSQAEELQENEPEAQVSGRQESISGTVILRVHNQIFEGRTFLVDPTTPKSVWLTNNMEGMENETPIFAMNMSSVKPKQMGVVLGYSGKEVNAKALSGTFSMSPDNENTFTIALLMDENMKTFSFSEGSVSITQLTPEKVKLVARGTGLYSDIEKQEYLDNQDAEVEVEISFPNIVVDGKDIKRVDF